MKGAWTVLVVLVVSIFAVLAFSFLDLFLAVDRSVSVETACSMDLNQLDGAVATWALEHNKGTNDTPTWADICPEYLGDQPKCLKGGPYILTRVGEPPLCAVREHSVLFRTRWRKQWSVALTNAPARSASK
jgi:hypothetical protein